MPFDDRLKNLITPKRVHALCQLVEYKKMEKEELRNYLVPPKLNSNQGNFDEVYSFAVKGGLIETDHDGNIVLKLSKQDMSSTERFRYAIASRTFSNPDLTFCRFTAWYLNRGEKVYTETPKILATEFDREINVNQDMNIYNDTNINGWRTWACFLGFGFLHEGIVIPNVTNRVIDVINFDCDLTKTKPYFFRNFMDWLVQKCPELEYGLIGSNNRGNVQYQENHLSVGLSAALRSLHDTGKIKLRYVQDTGDAWYLTPCDTHEISERVSEITLGGIYQ